MYSFLLYFFSFGLLMHNVPVSDTSIYLSDLYLDIEITLEANDVKVATQSNTLSQQVVIDYVNQHLSLTLDSQSLSLSYCHYAEDSGHLFLSGETPLKQKNRSQLQVENSLLINVVENQSNNVYCHSQDLFKGYLMNKERQTITIGLTK